MHTYRIYNTFINTVPIIAVDVLVNDEWFRDYSFAVNGTDDFATFSEYLNVIVAKNRVEFPDDVDTKGIRPLAAIEAA